MKNAVYNFLNDYIKRTNTVEDKDREKALNKLFEFFECLPERAKTMKRTGEFDDLVIQFIMALDKTVEKIANCPFIKIEIFNK